MNYLTSALLRHIPDNEITFQFVRSSGAGGQNVNKVSTKVVAVWAFQNSVILNEEQKRLIYNKLSNHLSKNDEVVVSCQTGRSQAQNRSRAVARLNEMVAKALLPKKKRIKTKPSRVSREIRLYNKKKRALIKKARSLEDKF